MASCDSGSNAKHLQQNFGVISFITTSFQRIILTTYVVKAYRSLLQLVRTYYMFCCNASHCSSSFLTRLFYHYYYFTRAAMSLGGFGSAYGSSLASLSLNQSKNINKINNNESKNTDIQRLLEGLCFAAC